MSGKIDDGIPLPIIPPSTGEVRHNRRLFDKVVLAFHHACDVNDQVVAGGLLALLDTMATRPARLHDGNRRKTVESLVAAHHRLWHLRHPGVI